MAIYEAFIALRLTCVLTPNSLDSAAECLRELDMLHKLSSTPRMDKSARSGLLISLLRGVEIVPGHDEFDNDTDDVGTEDNFGTQEHDSDSLVEQYDNYGTSLNERGIEIREGKQASRKVLWLGTPVHQELSKVYMAVSVPVSMLTARGGMTDYSPVWQSGGDEGQVLKRGTRGQDTVLGREEWSWWHSCRAYRGR